MHTEKNLKVVFNNFPKLRELSPAGREGSMNRDKETRASDGLKIFDFPC